MAKDLTLDEKRERAATKLFEWTPMEGLGSFDSWNRDGDIWSRALYWENEDDPDADSVLGSFGVRFAPNSDEIIESWQQ